MYISTFSNFNTWYDEIVQSFNQIKNITKEIDDYRNILELPSLEENDKQTIQTVNTVEFKHVWFRYNNTQEFVLKDISFILNNNNKISLVGENGSGKSTIVKLLCGLYYPEKGEILINKVPLEQINRKSLFDQLAVVFQDINIFAFSIASNIALCEQKKIDQENVRRSIQLAGYDEILNKAPKEIDTVIQKIFDEDGIELSGGENQGIAIARAIYKKESSVVILDEPTSHLDALSECKIYNKYAKLSNEHLSIFVSHRLASTKFSDKILFIEKGKVLGFDTHENLMKNGKYQEMYNVQAHYYIEEGEAC
jgi:ATP-binding cassette subfamily C protein